MRTTPVLFFSDSTHIVFTSDNGGFAKATDNSPLRANKGSHYEGGIRVPMIFSGPGIRKGEVSDVPVITNDLYPTILDLVGMPERPQQHLDGVSLAGFLKDGEAIQERSLFWHYPHYNQHPQSAPVSVIRKGQWKLIEFLESGKTELCDLATDIGESNDLYGEKADVVSDLKSELDAWREEVGADPMKPNPQYNP